MLPRVPDYIQTLVPYVPGKPIEETQREYGLKHVIKLASNENSLGPSPVALKALTKATADLHRYPDAGAYRLKKALAKQLNHPLEGIVVGNGSNEIIDMVVRTFCVPGDAILTSKGAFIAYKICAQIHGVETVETPMGDDLKFDLKAMLRFVRQHERIKIVFIANPNNPTGTYLNTRELTAFLRELQTIRGGSILAVLDYAYWEYVTAKDLPDPALLLKKFSNVIVLRTFSKIYGLAGLRLGYGQAEREVIMSLEKVRQPFNVNLLALAACEAALSDERFVARSRKLNAQSLAFWEKTLKKAGIPYWPTQGNFILIDTQRGFGKRGVDVYLNCLKKGVIFRPVANYDIVNGLRISFGTMAENRIAARALLEEKTR